MNELIQAVKAQTEITPNNWRETRTAMMTARDERHAKAAELEAQAAALRSDIKQAPNMQAVISHFRTAQANALTAVFDALHDFANSPDNVLKVMVCAGRFPTNGTEADIIAQLGQNVVDVGVAALITGLIPQGCDLDRWGHDEETKRVNGFNICKRNGLAVEHIAAYEKARQELHEVTLFARGTF
ncbi:MAG: hypothetical protein ACRCYB_12720 [Aeromonas veronii]